MNSIQSGFHLDIFEKETIRLIRYFFYRKKIRKFRVVLTILIIPLLILGGSRLVKADLFYFYSPLCLGSWNHVKNVEGEPQLADDADISQFDSSNSAILKNSSGQVFCGKFESANQLESGGNIKNVKLRLSIAVEVEQPIQYAPKDVESGATLEADEGQDSIFIIEVPVVTEEDFAEESGQVQQPSDEKNKNMPEPTLGAELTPTPAPQATTEARPEPTPEAMPEAIPKPTPQPGAESESEPSSFMERLINYAYAQESDSGPESEQFNLDDLLSIKYTLDGENWNELGRVSASNWRNLNFEIPINSVEETQNIQVGIFSLPTMENKATIYLDSIWIEIEFSSNIFDFMQDIGETIFETVTLQNLPDIFSENTVVTPTPTQAPLQIKVLETKFKIKDQKQSSEDLEWYPREDSDKLEEFAKQKNNRKIKLNLSGNSQKLRITGLCENKYYVVLIYRNEGDYLNNPSLAVYNQAFPCNGEISHDLKMENVLGGDYYLLIGEQGETGTWVPISDLIKINIEIIESE